jgi:hypothetical protein
MPLSDAKTSRLDLTAIRGERKPIWRAGDETRTRDIQLGRLALYQLSYSRIPSMVPGVGGLDGEGIAFILETQVTAEDEPP